MANYPAFFTLADSTAIAQSGTETVRASNGALKVRHLWAADKLVFTLGHLLTPAQRAQLQAFYDANRHLDVTYTWPKDGVARTVRFVAPPDYKPLTHHFEVRVRLEEA